MRFFTKPILSTLLLLFIFAASIDAANKFTLVIDAGHGGHDHGAIGKITNEKTINLDVALKFGKMVEKNYPDVKVVYTRKTDVFIPLKRRADIANSNNADLFVSIHTNAARSTAAYGTETYVLGLHKTQANLDVAMRENSVITLEEDYKEKYNGFDPKSIDSYIMFEFMQDRNLDKSLRFASLVEQKFSGIKRHSRGVRQAGFVVLYQTATPSVLVELGFISNANEERYLKSETGRDQLARSIYHAFEAYKREHDKKSGIVHEQVAVAADVVPAVTSPAAVSVPATDASAEGLVYKLQLFAIKKKLSAGSAEFKGLKNIDFHLEGGLYKYTYGVEATYGAIENLKKSIAGKFPDAYIIVYLDGRKLSPAEARPYLSK